MPSTKPKPLESDVSIEYLLLLSNSTDFKPDFHATATAAKMTSANHAQKKFKKIVKQGGKYKLEKGRIVAVAGAEDEGAGGE